MELVRRDRRSLEHRKSSVGEYSLMRLPRGPVFARHIAIVGGGIAPGKAVAFIVRTHAMEAVAARQLSFEVEDVGEFDIRRRALIVITILVEPRDGIRARSTIGDSMILRDRRRARFRCRLRFQLSTRQ